MSGIRVCIEGLTLSLFVGYVIIVEKNMNDMKNTMEEMKHKYLDEVLYLREQIDKLSNTAHQEHLDRIVQLQDEKFKKVESVLGDMKLKSMEDLSSLENKVDSVELGVKGMDSSLQGIKAIQDQEKSKLSSISEDQKELKSKIDTELKARGDKPNNPADIVHATCVALAPNGWAAAVPRDCSEKLTCHSICAGATLKIKKAIGNQGANSATCFNTLHFYHAALDPANSGKAYMTMYKYGGACESTGCGPNFCCCRV